MSFIKKEKLLMQIFICVAEGIVVYLSFAVIFLLWYLF